jgi:hypothetical protein
LNETKNDKTEWRETLLEIIIINKAIEIVAVVMPKIIKSSLSLERQKKRQLTRFNTICCLISVFLVRDLLIGGGGGGGEKNNRNLFFLLVNAGKVKF